MALFNKLIDLVRSPELIKMISKECYDHVNQNRGRHLKEQIWFVRRVLEREELKLKRKEMKEKKERRGRGIKAVTLKR